jgi:hypothetical protein
MRVGKKGPNDSPTVLKFIRPESLLAGTSSVGMGAGAHSHRDLQDRRTIQGEPDAYGF